MAFLKNLTSVLLLLCAALCSSTTKSGEVEPGAPAPALSVKSWFKGTPVTAFSPSKTYVVEFWATWCGPCKESIPHLTELAKKNPDVTFVGVSIWEDDKDGNIAKFVKDMGDKMNYNVGYSGNQDGMAKTWMTAAGQNGIPTAFIVKGGNIQWVGHPMEMEGPLAQVKAGTFNIESFKGAFDERTAPIRHQMELQAALGDISTLHDQGKAADAKAKLDALIATNPELKGAADSIKFGWLAKDDPAVWSTKAAVLAASKDQEKQRMLMSFAVGQAEKGGDVVLGRKAIEMVIKASGGKDITVLLYANAFYNQVKDYKAALGNITKILAMLPTSQYKDQPDVKTEMQNLKKELEAKVKDQAGK